MSQLSGSASNAIPPPGQSKIEVLDRRSGQLRPLCASAEVEFSSSAGQSTRLQLERQVFPPGELPEMQALNHVVAVHRSSPIEIDYREHGSWQRSLIRPNDIFMIPQGVWYQSHWSEPANALLLSISTETIRQVAPEAALGDFELVPLRGGQDELIRGLALALEAEMESGGDRGALYHDSLTVALATHLLFRYGTQPPGRLPVEEAEGMGLGRERLRRVLDYIEAHLIEDLRLSDLAQIAGLSTYHFSRLFKQAVGIAPGQYVLQQRIERAKRLLKQPSVSVQQVAKDCGFGSASYFARQFRKAVGVTPKAFQEAQ